MKQILQNIKTGRTELVKVPAPLCRSGHVLIASQASLISAGTERMLVDFGRAGYLAKAKSQPEKVKQVLDKVKTDGILPTVKAVRSKLDQPIPLGYSNVGKILDAPSPKPHSPGLKVGERVVSNGPHAEVVCVPRNLCAKIPDNVSDEEAAFTVVGAIGLQGVRLVQPTIGEYFVVTGLGLIGLLTVQFLRANGCRVLGIDVDSAKGEMARQFGAESVDISRGEDPVEAALVFSKGRGVDGVLITAATKSSEPVHQAAQMCRKRGRIVLVGVTGLELNRDDFHKKELSFQVSCSYGPGRYDAEYEEKGYDYPVGYVRWTEQRNFEAVLDLMAAGKINVTPLITHRFPFEAADEAYDLIATNKEPYVGITLKYGKDDAGLKAKGKRQKEEYEKTIILKTPSTQASGFEPRSAVIGLIGAGNFTGQMLLPPLQKTGVRLKVIASSGGFSGTHLGKKFGFEESTTDVDRIFNDPELNTIFITTRHNTHAQLVLESLKAWKNVFVEKPLCLTLNELKQIADLYNLKPKIQNSKLPLLMVGFNRRFAPHVIKIKSLLESVNEPKSITMTVNAGMIPAENWTQDPEVGGGRIIGEACHFIDLLRFLTGMEIVKYDKAVMQSPTGDTSSIYLSFADGSIGTVHYFANGNKRFPKERLEVFCGEKILQLDNFKVLRGYGWKGFKKMSLWSQDKGHRAEVKTFVEAIENERPSPIPFEEIKEVMDVTLRLAGKD